LKPTSAPNAQAATSAPPSRQTDPTATLAVPVTPTLGLTPPAATPVAMQGTRDFTFAVCGDNRGGPQVYRQVLDSVQKDGSAFLINTGDLVSGGTVVEFEAFAKLMRDFKLPFYPTPGNHDNGDGLLTAYLKHSGAPAAHYAFDYGLAHFSLLNTSLGDASAKELEWLGADLDTTQQPLKVVALHYPPFDPAGTDHIMLQGNQAFMDLVTQKGVRLVLAGHIHSYDNAVRDGVRYIITGGAGAPLYEETNRPAYNHYVRIMVKGEEYSTEVIKVGAGA
jgi:3',5'-cyclic AMP phosphodiesterase CpdA